MLLTAVQVALVIPGAQIPLALHPCSSSDDDELLSVRVLKIMRAARPSLNTAEKPSRKVLQTASMM